MSYLNITVQSQEALLVNKTVQGDLEAFNQLVMDYQGLVFNHALALFGDDAIAEDVTQDGFIKAYQNIKQFRGGSFRAWLLRIVTNTSFDIMRQNKRHPTTPLHPENTFDEEVESPSWLTDPSPSVQAIVEQKEFSTNIHRLLDELPVPFRSVLTLIDLYDLDYQEAAEVLGIPIGTVKSRIARARLQMKKKLEENNGYSC